MKKFQEYKNILNVKYIKNDYTENQKIKIKNQIIESIGSYEDYKILEDAGYDYIMLHESELIGLIQNKSQEHNIKWGGPILQTLINWMLQPIIKKLGVQKDTLAWYMITYGVVEAAFEFKDELTKLDKKPVNWCNVFTKGATEGLLIYMGSKSINKLINAIGINIGTYDSGNMAGIVQNGLISFIKDGTLDVFIEDNICSEGGLWDIIMDNAYGSISKIGGDVTGFFKGLF